MPISISIIVPFYNGNKYLGRLISSIEAIVKETEGLATYEVVIVNDSPEVNIELPQTELDIKVVINEKNLGIQGARVNGFYHSNGEWLVFLDQDDELLCDGFKNQIALTEKADVIVGNGTYILGEVNQKIFDNQKSMEYLIQEERFIQIRNLIPSPGECLIKRNKMPQLWLENKLIANGADDWFLWLLLFKTSAKFVCNAEPVYIHNDAGGENLSADLRKMKQSALEAVDILLHNKIISDKENITLRKAIDFKYYQDTNQLSAGRLFKYYRSLIANIRYRLTLNAYKKEK